MRYGGRMRSRAWLLFLASAALGGGALGCGETWQVVSPGDATAFVGKKSFMFDAVSLSDVRVDGNTEQDYVDTGDDIVELWHRGAGDVCRAVRSGAQETVTRARIEIGPGPTIDVDAKDVIVGELFTVDNNPNYIRSQVTIHVKVDDAETESDTIVLEQSAHSFATKPIEKRFASIGDHLGTRTADFVKSRVDE